MSDASERGRGTMDLSESDPSCIRRRRRPVPASRVLVAALAAMLCSCAPTTVPRARVVSRTVGRRATDPAAPLGGWRLANGEAPLAGLAFDMDVESAWAAAPQLRDAMRISLPTREYDALAARLPGLGEGSTGGTQWLEWKTRQGRWTQVAGAEWELRVELDRGLHMVTARFPSEAALRRAVAGFGPPRFVDRWEFWVDESSHTRAAFTGCHTNPLGLDECRIEFAAIQSLDDLLGRIFPGDRTLVGRTREEVSRTPGYPMGRTTRYSLRALPTTLGMPLEVQFSSDGRVIGYRTAIEWAYYADARAGLEAALRARVDGLPEIRDCVEGTRSGVRVQVCRTGVQFDLTVGQFGPDRATRVELVDAPLSPG